jgi:hypothetical protein
MTRFFDVSVKQNLPLMREFYTHGKIVLSKLKNVRFPFCRKEKKRFVMFDVIFFLVQQ